MEAFSLANGYYDPLRQSFVQNPENLPAPINPNLLFAIIGENFLLKMEFIYSGLSFKDIFWLSYKERKFFTS